jgi:hypothetical protein
MSPATWTLLRSAVPGLSQVNVDFLVWMIDSLDREARRLAVTQREP